MADFAPCASSTQSPPEFRYAFPRRNRLRSSFKAIVLGILFGLLFWRFDRVSRTPCRLTVSASIPIAVLAISVLKRLGGSTILENNIVHPCGSAGNRSPAVSCSPFRR